MASVLLSSDLSFEFAQTEGWRYLRPIFIFGRFFGVSYVSPTKRHRNILKIFCAIVGLFAILVTFRSLLYFKDFPTNKLTAETVFKIISACGMTFGTISWAFALNFQNNLNDLASLIKRLKLTGYTAVKPVNAFGQKLRLFILGLIAWANFIIMMLAGFGYIPFAFYPYFFDFLISDEGFLIFLTALTTFLSTGSHIFSTAFQLIEVFFVRDVVKQFNEKLANPNLGNPNELCSDHFLICKLKEHINRMWSLLIFFFDTLFIIMLVVVGFLLVTQKETEYNTKTVLIFWIIIFLAFFVMLNIPAIMLNEESDKSMGAVFQRLWVQREAKVLESVSFL